MPFRESVADDLITPEDAQKMLHFKTVRSIYRWIREGRIPAAKYSDKKILIRRSAIEALQKSLEAENLKKVKRELKVE